MKKVVYIYRFIKVAVTLAICAAAMCLCACEQEVSMNNTNLVEVPKHTPHPTQTPQPTSEAEVQASPTPEMSEQVVPSSSPEQSMDVSGLAGEKLIALTFDDGPYGETTNRILDVVEAYADENVHVTFFTLGSQVEKFPNVVKRANELGCEIANHTYDHKNLTKISEDEIVTQVESEADLVENLIGIRPRLVRPPYGAKDDTVRATVQYPLILWSIDTLDWKTRDADSTVEEAMKATDGDIVLMHDVRESTAEAAEKIIPALLEQGYKLVTVSELFEAKGISLSAGQHYRKAK